MRSIKITSIIALITFFAAACSADVESAAEKADATSNESESTTWPIDEDKIQTTSSGLRYVVQSEGEGDTPNRGQNISVHYTGYLEDGTLFDSSHQRGQPLRFPVGVGRVIRGWDEGLQLMQVGEKRTLIIPPNLGYGSSGAGGVIPPNATLYFDVELISIE